MYTNTFIIVTYENYFGFIKSIINYKNKNFKYIFKCRFIENLPMAHETTFVFCSLQAQ